MKKDNGKEEINIAFQNAWSAFRLDHPEIFDINIKNVYLTTKTITIGNKTKYEFYLNSKEEKNINSINNTKNIVEEKNNMTNLEKYNNAFIETLEVTEDQLNGLTYQGIPAWDSVGHMGLIACLEDAFDIMMDTDDIIDFSSYEKGIEIMKKYEVEI